MTDSEKPGDETQDLRTLRIAAATFGGIVSIASDAIISTSGDQRIIHFNRGAEQMFGYSANEIIGQHVEVLIPPRFRPGHSMHVERFGRSPVQARRMGERREISGLRKNGEEFPAEASISKLDIEGERIYTVLMRDRTAQKRAERAQQFLAGAGAVLAGSLEVEPTLRNIVSLAVPSLADWCIIYESGAEGIRRLEIEHVDRGLSELRTELLAMPIPRLIREAVERAMEAGVPDLVRLVDSEEFAAPATNPREHDLLSALAPNSAIVVPLLSRDQVRGAIGLFRGRYSVSYDEDDFTLAQDLASRAALALDNARLYAQARDALAARDEILAIVSHDLGNPLSAIRIGTSLLLRRLAPEERESGGWAHLEAIRESTEQMERLIGDLLEVRQIESGAFSVEKRVLSVINVLRTAVDQISPLANAKNVTVHMDVDEVLPSVVGDRQRLLQVLSNILGNAVKFTPHGGQVTVSADSDGQVVRISVTDTGPGLKPEEIPHVFERFWQAKKGGGGVGLGLAITRGIVEAHAGTVWVESEEGKGACFRFSLPAAEA